MGWCCCYGVYVCCFVPQIKSFTHTHTCDVHEHSHSWIRGHSIAYIASHCMYVLLFRYLAACCVLVRKCWIFTDWINVLRANSINLYWYLKAMRNQRLPSCRKKFKCANGLNDGEFDSSERFIFTLFVDGSNFRWILFHFYSPTMYSSSSNSKTIKIVHLSWKIDCTFNREVGATQYGATPGY